LDIPQKIADVVGHHHKMLAVTISTRSDLSAPGVRWSRHKSERRRASDQDCDYSIGNGLIGAQLAGVFDFVTI